MSKKSIFTATDMLFTRMVLSNSAMDDATKAEAIQQMFLDTLNRLMKGGRAFQSKEKDGSLKGYVINTDAGSMWLNVKGSVSLSMMDGKKPKKGNKNSDETKNSSTSEESEA